MSVLTRSVGVVLLVFLAARWLATYAGPLVGPLVVLLFFSLAFDFFRQRH